MIVLSVTTALVMTLAMAVDACSDALGSFGLRETAELWHSSDPDVRAAGDSPSAHRAWTLTQQATSRSNLSQGERMSFKEIDEAMILAPLNRDLYITKAAMTIAAGERVLNSRPLSEALYLYESQDQQDVYYRDLVWELERINRNLPQGSISQLRVQQSYCNNLVLDYRGFINPPPDSSIRCNGTEPVR